jgi:stalled ribosome rescue protein Dom34
MERFIEETFGAKPLIEASKVLHESQELVEELRTARGVAAQRRIGVLLERLNEMAHLHHWLEESDLIASLQVRRARNRTALQRQLRLDLKALAERLHDRLLGAVVTRLEGRRR